MNRIIASILLLSFAFQTFNQGALYLDYLIDRAEYMRKCVNKYRPRMECGGKCLLMQRIKAKEKKDMENAPQLKMAEKAEIISSKTFFPAIAGSLTTSLKRQQPVMSIGHPVDRPSSIFHPPGC